MLTVGCSPVSWETEQTVPYCSVAGSVWYIQGTRNNLDEYIFYNDSVILWQYNYNPDNRLVTSILKRKLEILEKNIEYRDGDGEMLLLQYYRGYTVNEATGSKVYDWSTYNWIFFTGVWADSMHMGMYDELEDVQGYWTFYSEPPVNLDFTGW